jgi:two-component system NtrC family sensor kinase
MRKLFFIAAFLIAITAKAQNTETDSLKKLLVVNEDDVKRVSLLEGLSYAYLASYPDTALKYALEGLQLAKDIDNRKGEAICINALGNVYFHIGDNAKALEYYLEYLKIKEELKELNSISVAYYNIASVYTEEQDYDHALSYLFKAKQADEKAKDSSAILYDAYSLGSIYQRMYKPDSALFYINQSYRFAILLNDKNMMGAILNTYGETYFSINDTALASKYYRLSIPYAETVEDNEVLTSNYYGLAKIFKQRLKFDSSLFYGRKALNIARAAPFFKQVLEISSFLTDLFTEKKQFDSAFYYQRLSIATKDSLFSVAEIRKVQDLKFNEQQRQQAMETAKIKYNNKIKLFVVIFTAVVLLIIALLLWRNNKRVAKTLIKLRATQAQLIQSEKMASLGELTAGIAHEIQNPLNFVNNFSEVSNELINEMVGEVNKGNSIEVKTIAEDVKQNLEKIVHHGKRADAIVKSMLLHSRKSTGVKEPTDINALCDEYLRLSYHGLRGKDKFFNADLKTEFDDSIEKLNIVPEDIGRALLNLFNNAFYAVNEKKKIADESYHPTVLVQTKNLNDKIEIVIKDNGNGVPQNIIDKIFQPFFTTKPTGQGTGLGLSLAYDIITKEHNGTIKVKSKAGKGNNDNLGKDEETEFIIQLPVT